MYVHSLTYSTYGAEPLTKHTIISKLSVKTQTQNTQNIHFRRISIVIIMTDDPSLPKLLAALAVGVRAANNLPLSAKQVGDDESLDEDSENDDELDDEFNYQMAFPEFNSLIL